MSFQYKARTSRYIGLLTFTCNICGARNTVEALPTEPATCACGSNVRLRALAHLLSLELFGESLPLAHFPRLKSIRCAGMTDKDCIADILTDKFDYTNTHYDREPRLDITESHPGLEGAHGVSRSKYRFRRHGEIGRT